MLEAHSGILLSPDSLEQDFDLEETTDWTGEAGVTHILVRLRT